VINPEKLLKDLRAELPKIEQDILAYSEANPDLKAHLQAQYDSAVKANRTAEHFVAWREAHITQAAVAWVLTCVFVRFLEDNNLLDEPVLAGPVTRPDGSRPLAQARERMAHHFNQHPAHAERDYLRTLFQELDQYPVIDELLDPAHNPLWQIPVSDDGAKRLADFFQKIDPASGELIHDFTDPNWDTRFLGDLYQDLSEAVRKRYALLQTPEFVEEFILDYTLTPAIDAFGLPGLKLIDPTCGSGHFLLTTFQRVFDAWQRREPATNARHLAQRALDVVHGVDINPYAVAIAKFRLLIAAMKAAQSDKIHNAPDFHFHLAVGDSLLHGKRHESQGQGLQLDSFDTGLKHAFETEDLAKLNKILGQRYHVVVGNPPYITVKDKALNQAYRDLYPTCHRKYSLGVPFTERFFDLTLPPEGNRSAGFMGMITTNSFMKREFGKKLIEEYLPGKDLTHVIDTSGAYIPGHGTPTVLLVARNQEPTHPHIRAVLGIRGEPSAPEKPEQGLVWRSIVEMLEKPGSENQFLSVVNQTRSLYSSHPWSLGGGGADELKAEIEEDREALNSYIDLIGFGAILGEDDAFGVPAQKTGATSLPSTNRPLIEGEYIRDWSASYSTIVLFPYDKDINFDLSADARQFLWPLRTLLWQRQTFGKQTYKEAGKAYAEYHQIPAERNRTQLSISFAFVATHNHFVLDRGGKVFNRSAPVIKLPPGASEADHLSLLGLLNSSVAMFWMRQVFHGKGQGGVGQESRAEWEEFREFTGTGLKNFPVADDDSDKVLALAKALDELAQQIAAHDPEQVLSSQPAEPKQALATAAAKDHALWLQMIALQEELDWHCYRLYGLVDEDFCYSGTPPPVALGERPFEIALARSMAAGEADSSWFRRHGSTPITEMPSHWSADYRALVERRLQAIDDNPWIKLVEQSEYKRRWNREPWDKRQQRAIQEWLLDRLEAEARAAGPQMLTGAQLTDRVRHDDQFQQVAELYTGTELFDAQQLVTELMAGDEVPQMAAARLKPAAMPKFRAWQETWDKQRGEDAIDAEFGVAEPLSEADAADEAKARAYAAARKQAEAKKAQEVGTIPVPPKYAATDFRKGTYWTLRGKLDVPKERFFSLPGCEKPGDSTPVVGWAGLDHLQRAQAIAAWYMDRKQQDGWEAAQLLPMLVALEELIPWLKQWHNHLDPEFGQRMGYFYEGFLFEELRELDLTRDDLLNWQPEAPAHRRGRKARTANAL